MDISSFPYTQLVFAFSLGWTLKEVNINGDFNQYIWAFSLGWTQETDVRATSSSLLISSGKPEEVFPTNIFSVLNECPHYLLSQNYSIQSPLNFYWPASVSRGTPFENSCIWNACSSWLISNPWGLPRAWWTSGSGCTQISMTRSWRCSAVTSDATNISSRRRREIVHPPKEHEVIQMALEKTGVTQLMEFDEYITANQLNILTKSISFKGSHSIS